jgi:hypothetical protein
VAFLVAFAANAFVPIVRFVPLLAALGTSAAFPKMLTMVALFTATSTSATIPNMTFTAQLATTRAFATTAVLVVICRILMNFELASAAFTVVEVMPVGAADQADASIPDMFFASGFPTDSAFATGPLMECVLANRAFALVVSCKMMNLTDWVNCAAPAAPTKAGSVVLCHKSMACCSAFWAKTPLPSVKKAAHQVSFRTIALSVELALGHSYHDSHEKWTTQRSSKLRTRIPKPRV